MIDLSYRNEYLRPVNNRTLTIKNKPALGYLNIGHSLQIILNLTPTLLHLNENNLKAKLERKEEEVNNDVNFVIFLDLSNLFIKNFNKRFQLKPNLLKDLNRSSQSSTNEFKPIELEFNKKKD